MYTVQYIVYIEVYTVQCTVYTSIYTIDCSIHVSCKNSYEQGLRTCMNKINNENYFHILYDYSNNKINL